VKERSGATTAYGIIALSGTEPARLASFPLRALGENATASSIQIDAGTRDRVVTGAIAKLAENYVFPDVARRMGDTLRARLARGAYDAETNGIGFAARLHDDLREISRDKHLRVSYRVDAGPPPAQREAAARPREVDAECGFAKPARLAGNVGYLRFDFFASPSRCGATASAAMNALADAPALIVDLRQNGGGDPAMVAYVSSYLFEGRTHLNDLWTRRTNHTEEYWTRDVPGPRFGGTKPVYVLTSSRTFSGAEEFTYNLKSLKRATIVGETTGGGAHPVRGERIDDRFMIGVPFARAINPITKTNWEGTGVAPDVKVPAADALAEALRLVRPRVQP
jgi:retinol-binding protein 3